MGALQFLRLPPGRPTTRGGHPPSFALGPPRPTPGPNGQQRGEGKPKKARHPRTNKGVDDVCFRDRQCEAILFHVHKRMLGAEWGAPSGIPHPGARENIPNLAAVPEGKPETKIYIGPEIGGFAVQPPALEDDKNGCRTRFFTPNVNEKGRK